MINLKPNNCYIMGHRGMEIGAVENTLDAFRKAIKIGVEFIELDVQISADNEIIVFHDQIMNNKTPLKGAIRDHNLCEIKNTRITTNSGTDIIPTLAEVFELTQKTSVNIVIELKSDFLPIKVNELISHYSMGDRVIIDSFNLKYIKEFQKINKNLMYNWLIRKDLYRFKTAERICQILRENNLHGASMHIQNINFKTVSIFRKNNYNLFAWGIHTSKDYEKALIIGLNGFTAPDPLFAINLTQKGNNKK